MKNPFVMGIWVLMLLLTGCQSSNLQAQMPAQPQAWFDAPLDGSDLPLQPIEVVYHAGAGGGVLQSEFSVNGEEITLPINPDPSRQLVTVRFIWQPPFAGNYTLRARSQSNGGVWSEYAVTHVRVREEGIASVAPVAEMTNTPSIEASFTPSPSPERSLTPTLTPTSTSTSTATVTASPTACTAMATFSMNANCRRGPGKAYGVVTSLLEGQSVVVEGRNTALTWWWVKLPNSEAHCWVADSTVVTSCMPPDLPVIAAPPFFGEPVASDDDFYWGDCRQRTVVISVEAGGESPVNDVEIYYRLEGGNWHNRRMENREGSLWTTTLNSVNDLPEGRGQEAIPLQYYFVAANRAGLTAQSPTYANITLKKCP
ncbi:MAG: hypothetical protein KatS3mg045_1326 [Bellilinea sp.]|nr:MAG: hypothetical protein KatS3mg045_1326 [Bellilinea sp.]